MFISADLYPKNFTAFKKVWKYCSVVRKILNLDSNGRFPNSCLYFIVSVILFTETLIIEKIEVSWAFKSRPIFDPINSKFSVYYRGRMSLCLLVFGILKEEKTAKFSAIIENSIFLLTINNKSDEIAIKNLKLSEYWDIFSPQCPEEQESTGWKLLAWFECLWEFFRKKHWKNSRLFHFSSLDWKIKHCSNILYDLTLRKK